MAKAVEKVNKSKEIREYLKTHKNEKAAAIAEAVSKATGKKVSVQEVYQQKARLARKKGKRGRPKGAAQVALSSGNGLDAAIVFAKHVGGLRAARQLIDRLTTIKDEL